MSGLLLVYALALVFATAYLLALALDLPGSFGTVPAVWVLGFAEIVLLTEILSLLHEISIRGYLIGEGVAFVAAVIAWDAAPNRVRRRWLPTLTAQLRSPLTAALAIVLIAAFVYEAALAFGTTPNNWDSMWYHLSRAAYWRQQHSLGYAPNGPSQFNAFPQNADVGLLYTLVLARVDRYAAGVQLVALVATFAAVYGIARRLGYRFEAALLAAFVFASLPLVALEATTTQNDLVVASFVACAAFFLLGTRRRELVLAGVAVGLAVGTKPTGILALPLLAILLLSSQPRARIRDVVASSAAGVVVLGSYTYIQNFVESHRVFGSGSGELRTTINFDHFAGTTARLLYRFIDLSGIENVGLRGYVYTALVLAIVAAAVAVRRTPAPQAAAVALSIVVLSVLPVILPWAALVAVRGYDRVVGVVGHPGWRNSSWYGLAYGRQHRINERANEDWGYFGPLGVLVLLPLVVFGIRRAFGAARDLRAGALAVALPLFLAAVAATLAYNEFMGRFLIVPLALLAPLAATVARWRSVSWAIAAVGATMLFLNLVGDETKPSGFPHVGYKGDNGYISFDPSFHVWGQPRAVVEGITNLPMRSALLAFDRTVPAHAPVALKIGEGDWVYPFFGPHLSHHVRFVSSGFQLSGARPRADEWIVAAPGLLPQSCARGWQLIVVQPYDWTFAHAAVPGGKCLVTTT